MRSNPRLRGAGWLGALAMILLVPASLPADEPKPATASEAVEAAKRDKQKQVSAAERSATAVADAKLADAHDTRAAAAAKEANADRVEQLADAAKERDDA